MINIQLSTKYSQKILQEVSRYVNLVELVNSNQWRQRLLKTRRADHAVNLVCKHVRTTAWTSNSSLSL